MNWRRILWRIVDNAFTCPPNMVLHHYEEVSHGNFVKRGQCSRCKRADFERRFRRGWFRSYVQRAETVPSSQGFGFYNPTTLEILALLFPFNYGYGILMKIRMWMFKGFRVRMLDEQYRVGFEQGLHIGRKQACDGLFNYTPTLKP